MSDNQILWILMGAEVLLFICIIIIFVRYRNLYRAYDIFMRGKRAESLESTIVKLIDDLKELKNEDRINKEAIRVLNKNHRASYQKLGIVKYNAFKGMGGNLSFVLVLLDYTDSGFILNSVHSREGCYVYIKDVDRGQTEVVLGSEEKQALEQALGYIERKDM